MNEVLEELLQEKEEKGGSVCQEGRFVGKRMEVKDSAGLCESWDALGFSISCQGKPPGWV